MSDCGNETLLIITGRLLVAPTGTADPDDTLAYLGTWPVGWEDVGELMEAVTFADADETVELPGEIGTLPYGEIVTSTTATIATTVDWVDGALIQKAKGGTYAVIPAASGVAGANVNTLGNNTLSCYAIGIEAKDLAGNPFRVIAKRATLKQNGDMVFTKTDRVGYPIIANILREPLTDGTAAYQMRNITAVALA